MPPEAATREDEVRERLDGPAGVYAWRRLGTGPPLVLLNGYAATADDWDPNFVAALGERFTVLCPDHRGVGDSELGDGPPTIAAMAADVLALLDHLDLEDAVIAGWSMGGFVAQELARAAPPRVAALALLATDPGGPRAERADPRTWAQLVDRSGTPREQATRMLGVLFPPAVATEIDASFGELVAAARERLDPAALDAQEAAIEAWYAVEHGPLPELALLAAAGELDRVIPPANAGALAVGSGAWLARFEGCGHALMAQQPARLAALIAALATGRP